MDNNAFQEIGEHQKALDEMAQYVNSGEVKGIMFQLILDDDSTVAYGTPGMSFIEQIGLLEATKYDLCRAAELETEED